MYGTSSWNEAMTHLSVNLNVAALLRNRRDHPWPDIVGLARTALQTGAFGITVHPRPDQRHIRPSDVHDLRVLLDAEFPDRELNVEGFPTREFLSLAQAVRADQITLVPDDPAQATSDHGWDFTKASDFLTPIVVDLKLKGHRVALFVDPDAQHMQAAAQTGADQVELYTGPFGSAHSDPTKQAYTLDLLEEAARAATNVGLGINAGHDLTLDGTARLVARIASIDEVSIGHALFCDALSFGIADTVHRYLLSCNSGVARSTGQDR